MKQLIWITLIIIAFAAGLMVDAPWLTQAPVAVAEQERQPLYWVAPMDPNYRRDKPGKSPMGMDLVPVYADKEQGGDEDVVTISAAVENNLGVTTAVVKSGQLVSDIHTVGYVQFDEDRLHHIHSRVDGWIEKLNVSAVGERVKKGEVLFELYSPTLFNAQKDMVSALKTGSAPLIKSARQRLRLLGLNADQINAIQRRGSASERIAFFAQHDGIVSALNVRHGMYIQPQDEVIALGSIDTVWVIAEVFERQASWLAEEQPVAITVDSYPGEQWQATVDYIYPVLNPQSRTVQVRVRVDNRDDRLKPNMFANLAIHSTAKQASLSIPRSALIRGGRSDRVVLALGEGRFRSTRVTAGREGGDQVEIVKGVKEGDRVVTSAQFLIDSESNIDAEAERMSTAEERDSATPRLHQHEAPPDKDGGHQHGNHGTMNHD